MQLQGISEYLNYLGAIQLQSTAYQQTNSTSPKETKVESTSDAETLRSRAWAQRLPKNTSTEVLQAIESMTDENGKSRVADILTGSYTPLGYTSTTSTSPLSDAPEPRGLLKMVLDMVKEIKELFESGEYKNSVHEFYYRDAEASLKEAKVSLESFGKNLHNIVEAIKTPEPISVDYLAKPKTVAKSVK